MKRRLVASSLALLFASFVIAVPGAPPSGSQTPGGTRSIPASGTTSIRPLPFGAEGLQQPELRRRRQEQGGPPTAAAEAQGQAGEFNRVNPAFGHGGPFPEEPLDAPVVGSSRVAGSDALVSVPGLNHRDQRLANNGNQFSLEPPDQALCVGNGFVVEATNSVLRVHDSTGASLTGVQDLNTFLGYPPAIIRAPALQIGPQVIDPICLYDPDFQRFMVVTTTLGSLPDGTFTGKNTIDLAVSNTGDPTGAWTIYRVPAQNDGADGTPNHGCTIDGTTPGPCFQDYPHIGLDRHGVYVSTNEYDLFGPNFSAAQIFAFSKQELAAHPASVRVTLVENLSVAGTPGFTVWPAISPKGEFSNERNGTEYFLSTIAGDGSETGNPTGTARKIGVWALSNTASLNSPTPALQMRSQLIHSATYVFPPKSDQPSGPFPLGECVNDTTVPTPFGDGCWNLLFVDEPAHDEVISTPDALDTRMQQTWFVNGHLWGSAGTAVNVNGEIKAGIVWFRVEPRVLFGHLISFVSRQGYLALADNNLTMPAIAMTPRGQGAIAFTVMGENNFPTAAYARISERGRVGPIQVAAAGLGVDDGFTSYKAFVGDPPRTRWGDYGAAVTDGNDIWMASEYIAQTCTLPEWLTGAIGSCGGTRTALANWATRLTKVGT